ncbi:hypothetical protein FRC04_003572 [Tulasnella sp. 424]|nr:hypothetical protein FRC04_003572 [Tulasnella sp. 424]KAG8965570.1 hypothetical protein FRC05_003220 [Tulasnella sp. 425]
MYTSDLNNTWGTKRKYGERASSCASSAGSMDSRLSERFEGFNTLGNNRPSAALLMQVHPIFGPSPFPGSRHKKPRRDTAEESDDSESGSSRHAGLPGPSNAREAYFRMRTLIQNERKGATHGESIDQSSSCASISLDGKDIQTHGEPTDILTTDPLKRKPASGRQTLSRMRVAVVKWQIRKQFFELTADPSADSERSGIHTWRRRRAVADALFSTGSKGKEWAALVVRRFSKSTERQIAGLRAILRLRVEEERLDMPSCRALGTRPECFDRSYNLLNLIFLRSEHPSFFQDVVTPVLRDWPADEPCAIAWLAQVIPNFMPRVDTGVMSGYGRRVIQNAKPLTSRWQWGMWLLLALFLGRVEWTQNRTEILSVAKFILHVGMEALGNQTTDAVGTIRTDSERTTLKVLYSIVFTCLKCGGEDTLPSIVPSAMTLGPFVEVCIEALCANGSMTCSALKALALLRNVPTVMEDIPQNKMSALATCCMDIVLGRGLWNKALLTAKSPEASFPLIPEEDAFDVLCRLPQPTFPKALAAALADCPVCLDPSSQDHLQLFDMLEPLLWLSNMPSSIPEAHRALVDGDACEFLAKIILDSPQETWSWQDRAIWRVKGEAITCLGNIIEKMDEMELRSRLREDVVKAIVEMRDNSEVPLAQRDQGTFTLIRYKAAACRCGVVPFCAEKLVQDPESSTARE